MRKSLLTLLLNIALISVAFAQRSVSGTVSSATDQGGLPGVSVFVKGTNIGTSTDIDGRYSLQVPDDAATLVFSFIGYATREESIGNRSVIDVVLEEDVRALEEVVVVGYGTSTVRELAAAVSSVRSEELTRVNPVRIDQALQGQVAGMQITTASGSPGGSLNIRIRGLATQGDNNPLILVDGIIFHPDGLNSLNPQDIESIDVLKDASAAIYGVLGANGVIHITTKQGRRNAKPTLEFSGYYGIQETARKINLLNAREFAVLKNEAFAAAGQALPYPNANLGEGTDWQDAIFQRAPVQNYNLNLNGGSDKSTYSVGASFLDQEGIVGGDKASYRRYNGRLNFTTELAPKVTLQNILLYTHERRRTVPESGIASVLYNAINASPLASVRTPEGRYTYLEEFSDIINPLAQIDNTWNNSEVNKIVGKQELVYKVNSNFELSGRAGYTYAVVEGKVFNPLVYYGANKAQNTAANANLDPPTRDVFGQLLPVHNTVNESRNTYFSYNLDAFLNYNREFGDHKVKATLGTSLLADKSSGLSGTAYNVPYNAWEFADISMADGADLFNSTSSFQDEARLLSYFIRGEYQWKGRYIFSGILRRDGSTKFGSNNRFGYFPSASAAWVVSDEPFFNASRVQFLKARVSYGVIGSDRIGNWGYRALLGGEAVYPFNDQLVTGQAIGVLGNEDLKWETTHLFDVGFDANLFSDRLGVSFDYYIKTTRDLLFQPEVSGITGAYGPGGAGPIINAGHVRNRGIDLMLDWKQTVGAVSLFATYTLTTYQNEVIEMPGSFIPGSGFGVGGMVASRMQVGYPLGYFIGYKTEGVYQTQQEIDERGVTQNGARPGDLRYADLDGNGSINFSDDSDKTMIGSPIPDATMGLNVGFQIKGIDFSALLYSSIGNEIVRNYERQQPLANQLAYRIGRWTGEGSTNEHPRQTIGTHTNGVFSDYYVEDGSYLRVRNVQLGYTFPQALTERIGSNNIRVYIAVNNLMTLTGYRGFDPDMSAASPLHSGIDTGFYPQARTYMAGINLNF